MSLIGKRKGRPISRMQFDTLLKRFQFFLKRELRLTYDIPYILIDTDLVIRCLPPHDFHYSMRRKIRLGISSLVYQY